MWTLTGSITSDSFSPVGSIIAWCWIRRAVETVCAIWHPVIDDRQMMPPTKTATWRSRLKDDIPIASPANSGVEAPRRCGVKRHATRPLCKPRWPTHSACRPVLSCENDSEHREQLQLHRNFEPERLSGSCPLPLLK